MAFNIAQVQKLYVAYFNRPADTNGLAGWQSQLSATVPATQAQLTTLASGFSGSPEYAALYANQTNSQIINNLYLNLFGRSAETAGLNHWVGQLAAGTMTFAQIALQLTFSAQGTDATAINNKVTAATQFTNALDTPAKVAGYSGTAAAASARSFLASVTDNPTTLTTATANVAAAVASATAQGAGSPDGATIILTTVVDNIPGTAVSQAFAGLISSDATLTTFNATDTIVDTSTTDNDVFTITTEVDITAANSGLVRNIETINVNANASTLNGVVLDFAATNFSGSKTFNFDVTKSVTAVTGLTVTAMDINNVTVNASDDFSSVSLAGTAGRNVNINAKALGAAGTPTAVTVDAGTVMADVTITGLGHLNATSAASTGLLTATAAKNLSVTGTAATLINASTTGGDLTVANATAALNLKATATGDIVINNAAAAGSITATAGGTITLGTSGATSATFNATGTSSINANALVSMSVSGNGAAATYTMAADDHAALANITYAGSQNVTVTTNPAEIAGALSVTDAGSGVFTLNLGAASAGTTTAGVVGAVNTSGGNLIDVLNANVDFNNSTLTVKSGQEVTYRVDQTAGGGANTLAVGPAGSAASNTVILKLDDGTKQGVAGAASAIDLNALTITQAKTVTIDASIDTTSAGTSNSSTITALTASGANSNVTVNTGVNGLILAGTNTVGTGTFAVTGSGAISLGAALLTATAFNASTATGAVTSSTNGTTTGLQIGAVGSILTGSGNDNLSLGGNASSITVDMGDGNDTLTLPVLDFGGTATAVSLAFGAGIDTLILSNGTQLDRIAGGSISITGLENLVFNAAGTATVQADLLSGKTFAVAASAAGANSTVTITVPTADATVNLSTLVGSIDSSTSIAGMTFVTSGNATAVSISGVTNAINTITGSSAAGDVLTGGALADTFVYTGDALLFGADNTMLDTIAGGSQATATFDQITLGTSGAAVAIVATDSFVKMSGVEQITAVNNTANISIVLGASAETAGITRITLAADAAGAGTNTISTAAYTSVGTTLIGSADATSITGGAGADTITGGAGADTMTGGAGNDVYVFAGTASVAAGDNIVELAGGGTDRIRATATTDFSAITTVSSFDEIEELEVTGTSTVTFTGAQLTGETISLIGATGTQALVVTATDGGTTDLSGISAGTNWTVGTDTVTINGSANGDVIVGTQTADSIVSGNGADTITGGLGADTIVGGAEGDNFIIYNGTADVAAGETLTLTANAGTDQIRLNGTTDFSVMAVANFDVVDQLNITGAFTATFTGAQLTGETVALIGAVDSVQTLVINATAGATTDFTNITGSTNWTTGTDVVVINGADGTAENITGTAVADSISGGSGNDVLIGGAGNDTILGGDGADTITGGAGDDVLTGGAGIDTFVYLVGAEGAVTVAAIAAANGNDTIMDFVAGTDKLDLNGITAATSVTVATGALTTGAGLVYFLGGQAAGAADTALGVATAFNAATTLTAAAVNAFIVIVDNNSSAIYGFLDGAEGTTEVLVSELTLLGTINGIVAQTDIIFA